MGYIWHKLDEGIRGRDHPTRKHGVKPDMYFVLRYRVDGVQHQEALGWASKGWTLTKARAELAALKEAYRVGQGAVTLKEKREKASAERKAKEERLTLDGLWKAYQKSKGQYANHATDASLFKHFSNLHERYPETLRTPELDKLRHKLEEIGKSPKTVKSVLELLRRLLNFGVRHELCNTSPSLHFTMPRVDNQKTECLTPEQAKSLLLALDDEKDQNLASLVRLALTTGMRRGALLSLEWRDIDFREGFITLRGEVAKKRKTEQIPLNADARQILENVERHSTSPLVFCNTGGHKRVDIRNFLHRIREKAGLPEDFRPLHGLRHTYASWLASSGKVDLYTLQKLLTHDSPQMTQRYSHLADEALRRAAGVASECFQQAVNAEPVKTAPTETKILPFRKNSRGKRQKNDD
jgi:integrase